MRLRSRARETKRKRHIQSRQRRMLNEPVADARLGRDQFRAMRIAFQLLADLSDVYSEILNVARGPPELPHDHAVSKDLSGMKPEQTQEVVFLGRQLDSVSVSGDPAPSQIHGQLATSEDRIRALILNVVPLSRPDSGYKFCHTEGLCHIIIGSQIERFNFSPLMPPAGEDDNRSLV